MQVNSKKSRKSHYFRTTGRENSFIFNNRLRPKQTSESTLIMINKENKEIKTTHLGINLSTKEPVKLSSEELRLINEKSNELKLKQLVQAMLWEELKIEKTQYPEFSSKPQPDKYDVHDLFFRKAWVEKPAISEAAA